MVLVVLSFYNTLLQCDKKIGERSCSLQKYAVLAVKSNGNIWRYFIFTRCAITAENVFALLRAASQVHRAHACCFIYDATKHFSLKLRQNCPIHSSENYPSRT